MNEDYRKGYRDGFKDGIESEQERIREERILDDFKPPVKKGGTPEVPGYPYKQPYTPITPKPNDPFYPQKYPPYDYWYLLVKCEVCGKTGMVGNCGRSDCP